MLENCDKISGSTGPVWMRYEVCDPDDAFIYYYSGDVPAMIKCPMCGAENRDGAGVCRMCAVKLPSSSESAKTLVVGQGSSSSVATTIQPVPFLNCPVCETSNESSWEFCQQCGSKLHPAPPPPAEPAAQAAPSNKQPASGGEQANPGKHSSSPESAHCSNCGFEMPPGAMFCHNCGSQAGIARTVVMTSVPRAVQYKLVLIMEGDKRGETYDIGNETIIGRNSGNITFPHDEFMSGKHAKITKQGNRLMLTDEGSRNGTFVRITGEIELKPGDTILVGKQLFKVES